MVTLAAIFQQFGAAYRAEYGHNLLFSHKQAMQAIVQCRTAMLGGHVYSCAACDHTEYRYHSCRNRHCPQCQGDKAHQWLARQQEMLLPIPHYLLTFTLPAPLRLLARSHQKLIYNLLFRAAAEATQQLAQNPRWLGGDIGMLGVLHTWGTQFVVSSPCSLSRSGWCLEWTGVALRPFSPLLPPCPCSLLPLSRQVSGCAAKARLFSISPRFYLVPRLGCSLPTGWSWVTGVALSGTLHLSRGYLE